MNKKLIKLPYKIKEILIRLHLFLNVFIRDPNPHIRIQVVQQKYNLNMLLLDRSWKVRRVVAQMGYGLDILIKDKNILVRNSVIDYCKKHINDENCRNILLLHEI